VSSPQISPSQLQLDGQLQSQRVYENDYFSSSREEEDESAPMPESEGILIPVREVSILENTHDVFENTRDTDSS
jgi:hypothetical protein